MISPSVSHPLEQNPRTGEWLLRLRNHPDVILTPMRAEDAVYFVEAYNDPAVASWLLSPPSPFDINDGLKLVTERFKEREECVIKELRNPAKDLTSFVGGSPVSAIREVLSEGKETFIGVVDLVRCDHGEVMHPEPRIRIDLKEELERANNSLPIGDPSIVWTISDFLLPSHQGRGIMSDAIQTLLYDWGVPQMNIHHVLVGMYTNNIGSQRVFEKSGFQVTRTIPRVKGERSAYAMELNL